MEIANLSERSQEYFTQDLFQEAVALYHECIEIEPNNVNHYWNLGLALLLSGEESEAQEVWMSVLINNPAEDFEENSNALKQFLYGEAAQRYHLGKREQVVPIYCQIVELGADNPELYCNLGSILLELNRDDEAAQSFQDAIALNPILAKAWDGLGYSFCRLEKITEAIACYQKALELGWRSYDTLCNLGWALDQMGNYQAAILQYQEALTIKSLPGDRVRYGLILPRIATSTLELDFSRKRWIEQIDSLLKEPIILLNPCKEVGKTYFELAYQGKNDRELVAKLSKFYEQTCPSLLWTAPHCQQVTTKTDSKKIKIGFFSTFFKSHTISKFIRGIIAKFSKDLFYVYVFSNPQFANWHTDFIKQNADKFITIEPDLEAARKAIAQYELDILFYPEIGMEHLTYFLAFARLAPIQCITWGHPVTTGIRNIDYFFSSENLEPENGQEHYTEKLLLLKKLPTYYYKPQLPEQLKSRDDFNLSEKHHLYICLQSLFKFHPDFDKLLRRILQADPLGKLILLQGRFTYWQEQLIARFQCTMPDVTDRIIFLPSLSETDFLNLMKLGDVMLDPIYFGGGNTNYEAFALGVPIVTLPGEYMRGRVAYACYKQMGFTECIATNSDEYIEIALRLGTNSSYRQQVSQEILSRNHLLFEDEAAVREIEQCLLQLVR